MKIKKCLTFLLSIILILNSYSFVFLKSVSLDYIFFSIFALYYLIYIIKHNIKITITPLILIFFLLLLSCHTMLINPIINIQNNTFIYIIKLLLWGFILSCPLEELVDKKLLIKFMYIISIIATIYLMIQFIGSYIFNVNFSNVFNFGIIQNSTNDLSNLTIYRPASFFGEPAYYSTYILCTLSFLILDNFNIKKKKLSIIFLIFGIFLSTSTAGIYLLLILLMCYILKNQKSKRFLLLILLIAPIFFILVSNMSNILESLGNFGNLLSFALEKPMHYSTLSRLGGSYKYLTNLSGIYKLIGWGVGNEYIFLGVESTYMNSVVRLIIQFGYIGGLAFIMYILIILKRCNSLLALFLIILYIIKSFTGGAMFSTSGIFILILYKMVINVSKNKVTRKEC